MTQPLVRGECVGLPPAAVQRHHQLAMELLIQRMIGHHPLQLRHELGMLADRQPRLGQGPLNSLAQQVEPRRLFLQPDQPGHIRQRPPAPQRQRVPQVTDTVAGIS